VSTLQELRDYVGERTWRGMVRRFGGAVIRLPKESLEERDAAIYQTHLRNIAPPPEGLGLTREASYLRVGEKFGLQERQIRRIVKRASKSVTEMSKRAS
jgi:hypothetical protein